MGEAYCAGQTTAPQYCSTARGLWLQRGVPAVGEMGRDGCFGWRLLDGQMGGVWEGGRGAFLFSICLYSFHECCHMPALHICWVENGEKETEKMVVGGKLSHLCTRKRACENDITAS